MKVSLIMDLIAGLIKMPYRRRMRRLRQELERQQKIFWEVTVPNQLIELVRQAQMGEPFQTALDILVGADDRQKLMYPLTQVETIRATSMFACQKKEFSYQLKEYRFTGSELSGIVLATIQFQDDAKGIRVDYRDVPIYIRLAGRPGKGWQIDETEYL